ncbi:hypothetical protein [Roseisalinus antarcticus]|uniref:Uncharacterized protein n=1 Tax=Roseisalinus antarcticus TaxID=254357 RepID=A0A1Y5T9W7_9RHOB|nr:hypothetical protein [Roseisalinus antarcticus]SLN57328.1 hypothetical protein ROA7023_02602 [Roseisalinus antarcticus]
MTRNMLTASAIALATALPAAAQELTIWDWKSGDPVASSYYDAVRAPLPSATRPSS